MTMKCFRNKGSRQVKAMTVTQPKVLLSCKILSKMTAFGMAVSEKVNNSESEYENVL